MRPASCDGPTPFPVKPNAKWTGAPGQRPDLGHVARRHVDRTAPGVRDPAAGEGREEAQEPGVRLGGDLGIHLHAAVQPRAVRQPAAAPAEQYPAVRGGAEVVQERAAVRDALAAGPADLLDHVGHRLGEHDVGRGDGEPPSQFAQGAHGRGPWRAPRRPPAPARTRSPPPCRRSARTCERSNTSAPRSTSRRRSPIASRAGWSVAKSGISTPRRNSAESHRSRTSAPVSSTTRCGAPRAAAAATASRPTWS